jgi:2-C-methyl-D-erythritol 2,4-cyclodiphosphate synthase
MPNLFGIGFDIHKLKKGRKLVLGGVNIPFAKGLDGHSDADCLTHSIIDALLGAMNCGDIGKVFGVDRPETKDISSILLLKKTASITGKKYKINNIDAVVIAEKPKLSPYISVMKKNIAKAVNVNVKKVSIKSTTAKGLGAIGKGRAIASQAIACIGRK